MTRLTIPAALLALALPVAAGAADYHQGVSREAMLASLSPSLRAEVMRRMGPEQRVPEVVETIILNDLMEDYADVRSLTLVGSVYRAEVLDTKQGWKVIEIDPVSFVFS